jgi:tetratricopeptide (TPR) repeat protein
MRRRVPQIVGIYLVASWGFVEFVDWAVEQYVLSPHITNFFVLLMLLMLPSVFVLAWRHGAPGRDGWTKAEPATLTLNVVLAAVVLWMGFGGRDLGAATNTIVVEDETGEQVERQIPKSEFRKSVALYYYENEAEDPDLDWLSIGLTEAIAFDLAQDMFISAVPPSGGGVGQGETAQDQIQEAGFENGVGAPLALLRKIAGDRRLEYLTMGSFTEADGVYTVETRLYETERGKLVGQGSASGTDPFEVVDHVTTQLKTDLDVPRMQIEEALDLPSSDLLTSSVDAFRQYILGNLAMLKRDYSEADERFAEATELDPTFAMAHVNSALVALLQNEPESMTAAMDRARDHLYRLPERVQLQIRMFDQQLIQQDPDRAFATARYWAEVYPADTYAHAALANLHAARGEYSSAIAELETILALDPSRIEVHTQIGQLHLATGQNERAVEAFQRYVELAPEDSDGYLALGQTHAIMGEHDAARAAYRRARTIEPRDVDVIVRLARLEAGVGDFDASDEYTAEALEVSREPRDRYAILEFQEDVAYGRGRFDELVEAYLERRDVGTEFMDPLNLALRLMTSPAIRNSVDGGRQGFAFRELERLEAKVTPPFDGFLAAPYLHIYMDLGDTLQAQSQIERLQQAIAATGFDAYALNVEFALGQIAEMEGDCERAINHYEATLRFSGGSNRTKVARARCRLALGDAETAEQELRDIVRRIPMNTRARYELAQLLAATGRTDEAIEELEFLDDVWAGADPEFLPAQRARTRLEELKSHG